MIVFDMKCENGHVFEAWFKSSSAYDAQQASGAVSCPTCGTVLVGKAVMAPHIAAKSNRQTDTKSAHLSAEGEAFTADAAQMMGDALEKLRKHVVENCEYVGGNFAEEARAMHYGEKDDRGIYGETSPSEREELVDEGIAVISLPMAKKSTKVEN